MHRDDVFPSKYFKTADLNGKAVIVEIARAQLETLKNAKGEEQRKIVLYFTQAQKTLPLNMTNFDVVADICGNDTEDWPGKRIELYPDVCRSSACLAPTQLCAHPGKAAIYKVTCRV
jgi:hypothetical protein